jgi:hypothetical protein
VDTRDPIAFTCVFRRAMRGHDGEIGVPVTDNLPARAEEVIE